MNERPRTTAPSIAVGNLDGEIADGLAWLKRGEDNRVPRLIGSSLLRAAALGILADYDVALSTATQHAAHKPKDPAAHLLLARAQGALHLFDGAAKSLQTASNLNASAYEIDQQRAGIYFALGRIDEAEKAQGALVPSAEGFTLAALYADVHGKPDTALVLFDKAHTAFRDVSPFVLASMDFERARSAERRGALPEAKRWLREALEALPSYAHAAVHLVGLEPAPKALEILNALDARCDDPEVFAARADALRRNGETEPAAAAAERARLRFEALLKAHPEAFSDHAARFFLGVGKDAARALTLATQNAQSRPTSEAISLWLTAAQAAGNAEQACSAARAGLALKYAYAADKAAFANASSVCAAKP